LASLLIALFILAALLAACGQDQAGPTGVTLLPVADAKGQTWKWDARCQFGPRTKRACGVAGPVFGAAQLSGDEWNLGSAKAMPGSLDMSVNASGALAVHGDFPTTPPCTDASCISPSAYTWVRGFPSVLYGINQCHRSTSPRVSRLLPLPMRVSSIPSDLIGTTAYSLKEPRVTYDIAYDLWLNDSNTRRPCRTDGTIEVMVWTDYDQQALLPKGMQVGTASIPFAINQVAKTGEQAWSIYASDVYPKGRTEPWGGALWFVLDEADRVSSGSVSVDLSSVLSAVATLLQNSYGWRNFKRSYWLDTIPFGMEFGPQAGTVTGSGSSYFSLELSAYCLEPATTLLHARCAGVP
jgi:hypothetical protein